VGKAPPNAAAASATRPATKRPRLAAAEGPADARRQLLGSVRDPLVRSWLSRLLTHGEKAEVKAQKAEGRPPRSKTGASEDRQCHT
jgi:hypothetical protein